MIIFGTKARYKTIAEGEFFCPSCQKERHYERKGGKNYFALYFIPLIPMGDLNEFIECQTCGRSYSPEVLNRKLSRPEPDVAKLLNTVKARLERGYPIEYMISELTDDGVDRDIAANIIRMAVGDVRNTCPKCGLNYAAQITTCPDCKVSL